MSWYVMLETNTTSNSGSWDTLQALAKQAIDFLTPITGEWSEDREKDMPEWLHAVTAAIQDQFHYDPYALVIMLKTFYWITIAETSDDVFTSATEQYSTDNQDLLIWLSENNREDRIYYVDIVIQEGLSNGLYNSIQMAQIEYATNVVLTVLSAIQQEVKASKI